MNYTSTQTSFHDLVFVLFKRKWSFLGIVIVALLGTAVWLFCVREDAYTASAKILVKLGQEQAPPPTVVGGTPLVMGSRTEDVNSEAEILQNTQLVAMVVDEIGLDKPVVIPPPKPGLIPQVRYKVKTFVRAIGDSIDDYMIKIGLRERLSPREKAIAMVQGGLKVAPGRESNVFTAEMSLPDREGSAFVLNRLIAHYMEFRLKLYQTQGMDLFQRSLDTNAAALNQAEEKLQHFEAAGDISLLQDQQAQLVKQIAESEAAEKDAEIALGIASSRVARLDAELAKPDPNFGALGEFERDSFPNSILRQIAQLQQEREALRLTQLDTGDKIQNNRQQMNTLAGMLAANLRSTLSEKQNDYNIRKQTLDSLRQRLTDLHQQQMQWSDLKRQTTGLEENVTFYRRKLEEARAQSAVEGRRIGNVVLVQSALPPAQPSGLRKTWLLGLAAILAVTLAVVWIAILEILDHRIYAPPALERELGVPVFAVVPSGTVSLFRINRDQERHATGS